MIKTHWVDVIESPPNPYINLPNTSNQNKLYEEPRYIITAPRKTTIPKIVNIRRSPNYFL